MSKSIVEYMSGDAIKENISKTLGKKTPQFIASVTSLVSNSSSLAIADRKSVLAACLIAATLDLPINPNLGFAYVIPYKKKIKGVSKKLDTYITVAQFQMGYKGFIQLAMRSGQFRIINVTDVKEGELKINNRLTGEIEFEWLEEDRNKKALIGYVAYMELNSGFSKQLYMSVAELKKHGQRFSQTFKKGYGLWKDDFNSMASKTVVKLLLSKYAPMTVEMQQAQVADQAVVDGDKYEYIDNKPVDAKEMADEKERDRIVKHIKYSKSTRELEMCFNALDGQDLKVNEMYEKKLEELKNDKK